MIISISQFQRYLEYLGITKSKPTIEYLKKLTTAQIIKFPFENVSKLILWAEGKTKELIDFHTHLSNSNLLNCGGTCYANNYYFNQLLNFLGFKAELHGANMGEAIDVHLVSIVELDGVKLLVDVGYGAPFYKPMPLFQSSSHQIFWGELSYTLNTEKDRRPKITVHKNDEWVHDYIVNPEPRQIEHFISIIQDSFRDESEFMKCLRVMRYFEDYSIELKNFQYTIIRTGNSKTYLLDDIDALEKVIHNDFQLPNLPIRKAFNLLTQKLQK